MMSAHSVCLDRAIRRYLQQVIYASSCVYDLDVLEKTARPKFSLQDTLFGLLVCTSVQMVVPTSAEIYTFKNVIMRKCNRQIFGATGNVWFIWHLFAVYTFFGTTRAKYD